MSKKITKLKSEPKTISREEIMTIQFNLSQIEVAQKDLEKHQIESKILEQNLVILQLQVKLAEQMIKEQNRHLKSKQDAIDLKSLTNQRYVEKLKGKYKVKSSGFNFDHRTGEIKE